MCAINSIGRVSALQAGGCGFKSRMVHQYTDGYRNGYNGADLKSDVAKALWVRILHHPPYAPLSQSGRGDGFRFREVQVRILCGAPLYLVRLKQRTRSYGLRDMGWIPTQDTNVILSSNW